MLTPEAAYIFRITHVANVPWILDHGLHCKSSSVVDPNFVPIGMAELIQKRTHRVVPRGPGGTLSDYVPFYFTHSSVMLYNIKTGYNNVIQRPNRDIVILVSTLHKLSETGTHFVFTNGHAYLQESEYFEDLADLPRIDWDLLRKRDFQKDPDDPGKLGRYQAEALAHRHVPVDGLLGLACYDGSVQTQIESEIKSRRLSMKVQVMPQWYF